MYTTRKTWYLRTLSNKSAELVRKEREIEIQKAVQPPSLAGQLTRCQAHWRAPDHLRLQKGHPAPRRREQVPVLTGDDLITKPEDKRTILSKTTGQERERRPQRMGWKASWPWHMGSCLQQRGRAKCERPGPFLQAPDERESKKAAPSS